MESNRIEKYSLIKQEELVLEKELDLVRIDNTMKAERVMQRLGEETEKYIYIIDPYLHDPLSLSALISKSRCISELRIIFDFKICKDKCRKNERDIKADYYIFSRTNNVLVEVKSFSDKSGSGHHDRFLFTKDRVWSVGSSFNELGNKKTYIIDVDYITLTKEYSGKKKNQQFYKDIF